LPASTGGSLPRAAWRVLPANQGAFGLSYPVIPAPPGGAAAPEPLLSPTAGLIPAPRPSLPWFSSLERSAWEVPAGHYAASLPPCDAAYIRRLVRAAPMGQLPPAANQGLLIEPPASLFPHPATLAPPWWWHRAWGWLAYDPAEPDSRLIAA